jgi:hypothetical protein
MSYFVFRPGSTTAVAQVVQLLILERRRVYVNKVAGLVKRISTGCGLLNKEKIALLFGDELGINV